MFVFKTIFGATSDSETELNGEDAQMVLRLDLNPGPPQRGVGRQVNRVNYMAARLVSLDCEGQRLKFVRGLQMRPKRTKQYSLHSVRTLDRSY